MTFPLNIGQIPIYYNHKNTGRPLTKEEWFTKYRSNYLDVTNEPLYSFGYGLSYTSFEYGKPEYSATNLKSEDTLHITVPVKNTGNFKGKEVVQLYIRDKVDSITRPVQELKGFQKIELEPGEAKNVSFHISTNQPMFYNYDLEYVWEPGEFEIMIGPNSEEVQSFTVNWEKGVG